MTIQNSPHFELIDYRDLYNKAKYELDRLDKLVNSYDLFNFLCTINHWHDWAEKDLRLTHVSKPDKATGPLNVVRQLCNRAKHFEKNKNDPDTSVKAGYGMGRFGVGSYGVGEPSYTVEVDGRDVSVLQICKEAFAIWEEFMSRVP